MKIKTFILISISLLLISQDLFGQDEGCGSGTAHLIDRKFTGNNCDYYSWSFDEPSINIPEAWTISQGEGIKVAVIDEYISLPFLADAQKGESSGRVVESFNLSPCAFDIPDNPKDLCSSHATKVAGIMAGAKTNEGEAYGIAYKADLYHYRALSRSPYCIAPVVIGCDCEAEAVVNSINHARNNGVNIINMSIGTMDEAIPDGGTIPDWLLETLLPDIVDSDQITEIANNYVTPNLENIKIEMKKAYEENDVIMFAAGGSLNQIFPVTFPGNSKYTLGVTGIDLNGDRCSEGNFSKGCHTGSEVDFAVVNVSENNRYPVTYAGQYFGITSTATAHMSGITALLWSEFPHWSKERVINQLILSSSNYPDKDDEYGWGTVDIYKALTQNLADPGPVVPDRLLIEKIVLPPIDDNNNQPDDLWNISINGKTFIFNRDDNITSGVPTMLMKDPGFLDVFSDCFSYIMDFDNTNTLEVKIWKEGYIYRNCDYNSILNNDSDYFEEIINLDPNDTEGSFTVTCNSDGDNECNGNDTFVFHYKKYGSSPNIPSPPTINNQDASCITHSHIEFYDELNGDGKSICAADIEDGTAVDFTASTDLASGCLNNQAKSAILYNVSAGTSIRLFKENDDKTSGPGFTIRETDWIEIIVLNDIDEKIILSFTEYEDIGGDIRVIYHKNDGLNGQVSLYEASSKSPTPTIDFYDNEDAGGDLQCSIEILDSLAINFAKSDGKAHYPQCDNDKAESAILYDIPAGMTISLFDRTEDDNPEGDDWIEIYAKNNFQKETIGTFEVENGENPYENDNIIITYHIQDGELNNKVSLIKVGVNCDEDSLQVEINQTQVADCIGFGLNALEATVTGGTPPFTYVWQEYSTGNIVGGEASVDNLLRIGEYKVAVRGSRGCPWAFDNFIIESGGIGDLNETIRSASCGEADGSITLAPEGSSYSYQWSHEANPTSSSTNLPTGSYTVTVTNSGGCTKTETFEIEEDINFKVNTALKHTTSCNSNDGWAEVRLRGLEGQPSILWSTGDTTSRVEGLASGTYTVLMLDEGSSCSIEKSITILEPSVNITGGGNRVVMPGIVPSATLTASINCNTCTYIWSTGEMGRSITVSESGTYTVTVDDGNGCTYEDSQSVTFVEPSSVAGGGNNQDDGGGGGTPGNCESCPDGGGGNGNCSFWQRVVKTLLGLNGCPPEWRFPVLHAFDPNDIAGNIGYEEDRWVSVNERLGYVIRFENDPEFATGPAQTVTIRHPLDPNVDPYTLRLSDFGFGSFNFSVPPNSVTYNGRLDVTDSLGVFVDVIAGIDVQNNEAFWILKSIDPATGQTPIDASLGFLEVTDTTITRFNDSIPKPSEGFVSFSIMPDNESITGDTVMAQASIIFDQNAPIETNIWKNTIDAFPPISTMNPATYDQGLATLTWTGQDDPGGVGIQNYSIYYSVNGGEFELLASDITGNTYIFEGIPGNTYEFFTIAKDHVNNTEALKTKGEIALIFNGRIDFDIKVLLEGAYDPAISEMTTTLNTSRHILPGQTPASNLATPTSAGQPYNRPPWDYAGTEGANWTNDDYPIEAVDWVLVSFRTDIQKSTEIGITAAILLKDGMVQIPETFELPAGTNAAYIVIEHRNHVGAMTSQVIDIENNTLTHNFTIADGYDGNGTGSGQKQLPTGEWVMFAGDADQTDLPSYDILGSDKIPWEEDNGIFDYYTSPDFNMDGDVNGGDKALWFENNGISSRVPK